jgi:DNA-binding response OmpR family regulator
MLNEFLNAMMLAELLYDTTVASLKRTPRGLRQENGAQETPARILHVDDEPDIRAIVELSLGQEADFVTRSCGSGKEGLDLVADWKPDLLLLDLMMPQMGGETTLARLRTDVKSSMPVVFMTAFCKVEEPEYFRSLGAAGVIYKPFKPTMLAASVRSYLQV